MQLHTCLAMPANGEGSCSDQVSPPLPFCRDHYEEYCTLRELGKATSRDIERLGGVVDDMLAEGADGYTSTKDIRKDTKVVRLLLESLEGQIESQTTLRTRFFCEDKVDDPAHSDADALDDKRKTLVAFLDELEAKSKKVAIKAIELEFSPGVEAKAAKRNTAEQEDAPEEAAEARKEVGGEQRGDAVGNNERAQVKRAAASLLAHPELVLTTAHPPYLCTRGTSGGVIDVLNLDPSHQCGAHQCSWNAAAGERFCRAHRIMHGSSDLLLQSLVGALERSRAELARTQIKKESEASQDNVVAVRKYLNMLEVVTKMCSKHDSTFLCDHDHHQRTLKDLKERQTSAILLLGELNGRKDARIARVQGQGERWASEYMAEVQREENEKRTRGVVLGTLSAASLAFLGAPLSGCLMVGAAAAFVTAHSASKKT